MKKKNLKTKLITSIVGTSSLAIISTTIAAACSVKIQTVSLDLQNYRFIQEENNNYYLLIDIDKNNNVNTSFNSLKAQTTVVGIINQITTNDSTQLEDVIFNGELKQLKIKLQKRPLVGDVVRVAWNDAKLQPITLNVNSVNTSSFTKENINVTFVNNDQKIQTNNNKTILRFDDANIKSYTLVVNLNELNDDLSIKSTTNISSNKVNATTKEVEFTNLNPNSKYKIVSVELYENLDANQKQINDYNVVVNDSNSIVSLVVPTKTNYSLKIEDNNKNLEFKNNLFELSYDIADISSSKFVEFKIREWDESKNEFAANSQEIKSNRAEVRLKKITFANLKHFKTYKITGVDVYDNGHYANTSWTDEVKLQEDSILLKTPKQKLNFNVNQNQTTFVKNQNNYELPFVLNLNAKFIELTLVEVDDNNNSIDNNQEIKSTKSNIANKKVIFNNLQPSKKYKIKNILIFDGSDSITFNPSYDLTNQASNTILKTPDAPVAPTYEVTSIAPTKNEMLYKLDFGFKDNVAAQKNIKLKYTKIVDNNPSTNQQDVKEVSLTTNSQTKNIVFSLENIELNSKYKILELKVDEVSVDFKNLNLEFMYEQVNEKPTEGSSDNNPQDSNNTQTPPNNTTDEANDTSSTTSGNTESSTPKDTDQTSPSTDNNSGGSDTSGNSATTTSNNSDNDSSTDITNAQPNDASSKPTNTNQADDSSSASESSNTTQNNPQNSSQNTPTNKPSNN